MCQAGLDPEQTRFHQILMHLRDAQVTEDDWKTLMTQTPTQAQDLSVFSSALPLYPTVEAVVEYNVRPVANQLPPSKLFTPGPMHPRLQLMMQKDWKQ